MPPDWGKKVQRLRPSLASARRGGEERDPGFVVKTTPLGPGQMDSGAGENGGVEVHGEAVKSSCPWRVVPTTPRPPASASAGADTTPGVATPAVVSAPALATPEASSSSQLFSARLFLWPEMHALAALQGSPLTLGVGGSGGGSRGRKAGGSRRQRRCGCCGEPGPRPPHPPVPLNKWGVNANGGGAFGCRGVLTCLRSGVGLCATGSLSLPLSLFLSLSLSLSLSPSFSLSSSSSSSSSLSLSLSLSLILTLSLYSPST